MFWQAISKSPKSLKSKRGERGDRFYSSILIKEQTSPTTCTIRCLTALPKCYHNASHYEWTLRRFVGSLVRNMKPVPRYPWRLRKHCSYSDFLYCDWQKCPTYHYCSLQTPWTAGKLSTVVPWFFCYFFKNFIPVEEQSSGRQALYYGL